MIGLSLNAKKFCIIRLVEFLAPQDSPTYDKTLTNGKRDML